MARYRLKFRPSVARDLRGIPAADVQRILARIEALQDDPRPSGSVKLSGQERYRLRQGNYRVLYSIGDEELIVDVIKVAHRRDVYRDL